MTSDWTDWAPLGDSGRSMRERRIDEHTVYQEFKAPDGTIQSGLMLTYWMDDPTEVQAAVAAYMTWLNREAE
jgi:hypothetical protein